MCFGFKYIWRMSFAGSSWFCTCFGIGLIWCVCVSGLVWFALCVCRVTVGQTSWTTWMCLDQTRRTPGYVRDPLCPPAPRGSPMPRTGSSSSHVTPEVRPPDGDWPLFHISTSLFITPSVCIPLHFSPYYLFIFIALPLSFLSTSLLLSACLSVCLPLFPVSLYLFCVPLFFSLLLTPPPLSPPL